LPSSSQQPTSGTRQRATIHHLLTTNPELSTLNSQLSQTPHPGAKWLRFSRRFRVTPHRRGDSRTQVEAGAGLTVSFRPTEKRKNIGWGDMAGSGVGEQRSRGAATYSGRQPNDERRTIQSAIRNPQSEIRNPKSMPPRVPDRINRMDKLENQKSAESRRRSPVDPDHPVKDCSPAIRLDAPRNPPSARAPRPDLRPPIPHSFFLADLAAFERTPRNLQISSPPTLADLAVLATRDPPTPDPRPLTSDLSPPTRWHP
jgi:hypothetical protein